MWFPFKSVFAKQSAQVCPARPHFVQNCLWHSRWMWPCCPHCAQSLCFPSISFKMGNRQLFSTMWLPACSSFSLFMTVLHFSPNTRSGDSLCACHIFLSCPHRSVWLSTCCESWSSNKRNILGTGSSVSQVCRRNPLDSFLIMRSFKHSESQCGRPMPSRIWAW